MRRTLGTAAAILCALGVAGCMSSKTTSPEDTAMASVAAGLNTLLGRMADFAFECTAVPALGPAPLALVRHGGTAVQVSGIEQVVPFDCRLFEWDKTYVNPIYGRCDPARDFPILQAQYRKGALELDRMITKRYGLGEIGEAFDDLIAGRLAKGVLLPWGAAW